MKKLSIYTLTTLLTIIIICLTGCKREEVLPIYPAPNWKITPSNEYSVNMTAAVTLPNNLKPYMNSGDELAAFIGNDCRGVGAIIQDSIFLISIQGTTNEQSKVRFKYYSTKNKYLYETDGYLTFESNTSYGTIDKPMVLNNLQNVK